MKRAKNDRNKHHGQIPAPVLHISAFFWLFSSSAKKRRKMKPRTGTAIDYIEWMFRSKKSRVLFVFRGCTVWYCSKLHFSYQYFTIFVQETQNFDTDNKKSFTNHSPSPWFCTFFFVNFLGVQSEFFFSKKKLTQKMQPVGIRSSFPTRWQGHKSYLLC